MTDLPTLPEAVFDAAVKAYCAALPGFPSDTVHRDLAADAAGFRSALAAAYAAGRDSVPMRYGVRNPISGGPVYTHPDMSRAGVLRMAAADPSFHEAVCRRQGDWEPMRAEEP